MLSFVEGKLTKRVEEKITSN